MTQTTYKVSTLDGSSVVQFDHESEARAWAAKLMAKGTSVYLMRVTSEFVSLFDAKAGQEAGQ